MERKEYVKILNSLIDSKTKDELNQNIKLANEFIKKNELLPETPEFKKFETVVGLMKVKLKNKRKMEFESIQEEKLFEIKKNQLVSIILEEEKEYVDYKDYKKPAQKILNVLIPKKIKYVESVEVLKCFTYKKVIGYGDYRLSSFHIYADIKCYIDKQPLLDAGIDTEGTVTEKEINDALGFDLFERIREELKGFPKWLSIQTTSFSWEGQIFLDVV